MSGSHVAFPVINVIITILFYRRRPISEANRNLRARWDSRIWWLWILGLWINCFAFRHNKNFIVVVSLCVALGINVFLKAGAIELI